MYVLKQAFVLELLASPFSPSHARDGNGAFLFREGPLAAGLAALRAPPAIGLVWMAPTIRTLREAGTREHPALGTPCNELALKYVVAFERDEKCIQGTELSQFFF